MKLKPAETCLGCCSLLAGTEAAAAVALVLQVLSIALCSSAEPLRLGGLVVGTDLQVLVASWGFIGIPICISGGVGALHRIEGNVRLMFYYMSSTFFLDIFVPIHILFSNSLCDLVVDPALQNQGTAFVCGFANTFIFVWSLMGFFTHAYLLYIVWSLAEDIKLHSNPELVRYELALRGATVPEKGPAMATEEVLARAAYAAQWEKQQRQEPPPRFAAGPASAIGPPAPAPMASTQAPGPVSMALAAAAAQAPAGARAGFPPAGPAAMSDSFEDPGAPQSFFPAPAAGANFASGGPRLSRSGGSLR